MTQAHVVCASDLTNCLRMTLLVNGRSNKSLYWNVLTYRLPSIQHMASCRPILKHQFGQHLIGITWYQGTGYIISGWGLRVWQTQNMTLMDVGQVPLLIDLCFLILGHIYGRQGLPTLAHSNYVPHAYQGPEMGSWVLWIGTFQSGGFYQLRSPLRSADVCHIFLRCSAQSLALI